MSGAAALKHAGLVRDLSEDERETLFDLLEPEEVPAGRALFEEGADGDGLLLVAEGEVALESRQDGEIARLGPGGDAGALSLVAAGRREMSAVAATPCTVLWLERSAFHRLMDDAPRVACKLLEAVLRNVAADLREALPGLRQTLPSGGNDGPQ